MPLYMSLWLYCPSYHQCHTDCEHNTRLKLTVFKGMKSEKPAHPEFGSCQEYWSPDPPLTNWLLTLDKQMPSFMG